MISAHVAGHDDAGVIGDLVSQGNLLLIGPGGASRSMIFFQHSAHASGWSGALAVLASRHDAQV